MPVNRRNLRNIRNKKKGQTVLKEWTFNSYIENLQKGNYSSININTFHSSLTKFIRETPNPIPFLSKLEELADEFEKALKKVDRRKIAFRDDFLTTSIRIYSFLNHQQKVKNVILSVENDEIDNIHKDFVLTKIYKYAREGENYCRANKRWAKAIREYQNSEKGKTYKKTINVKKTSKKGQKKGFFAKLLSFFGL